MSSAAAAPPSPIPLYNHGVLTVDSIFHPEKVKLPMGSLCLVQETAKGVSFRRSHGTQSFSRIALFPLPNAASRQLWKPSSSYRDCCPLSLWSGIRLNKKGLRR